MTCKANGFSLVKADIHEPVYGLWFADLEVDTEETITGTVTLSIEGVSFVGAVWNTRAATESSRWLGRIVGGAAGMGTVVTAKNYVGVNVRGALDDIMRDSGETLDVTNSDATVLARSLPRWHRMQSTAGSALALLMDEVDSSLRMQRTGQVKVGSESYAEVDFSALGAPETDSDPRQRYTIYAPPTPVVEPGSAIDGAHVEYVWTELSGSSLRQTAWFADA